MKVQFRSSVLEELKDVSEHAEMRIIHDNGDWISFTLRNGLAEITGSRPLIMKPIVSNNIVVRPERFEES